MALTSLLRWPLPALLSWAAAWALFIALRPLAGPLPALLIAGLAGAALALLQGERWRRLMVALGFPLSALLMGGLPAWAWLLPFALLIYIYPRRTWSDAPLYPTPAGALKELAHLAPLPAIAGGARVLDAGCGLGHGLRELRAAYPQAQLEGIEWSRLLALLARWRCPWARVCRGDMWAPSWAGYELVYVFQRPESMARVWAKARAEMKPGAWLVSLDFDVPDQQALHALKLEGRHLLWVYSPLGHTQGP